MEKQEQKTLNNAFIATLLWTGINILFFFLGYFELTFLGSVELVLFLSLGYLTMKGNKMASLFLLILFLLDRAIWLINMVNLTETSMNISNKLPGVSGFFISFALWLYFYSAYLTIRKQKPQTKDTNNIFLKYLTSQKVILSLLCLLLFSGWFYWFQWRPYDIRKKCSDPRYALSAVSGKKINEPIPVSGSSFNNLYRFCLTKHGLRPESILEPASLLDK